MIYSSYPEYLQSEQWKQKVHIMMNRITDKNGRKGWKDSLSLSNYVLESEV